MELNRCNQGEEDLWLVAWHALKVSFAIRSHERAAGQQRIEGYLYRVSALIAATQ